MFKRKDIISESIEEGMENAVLEHDSFVRVILPELEISDMNSVQLEGHIISDINYKVTDKAVVVNFKLLCRKIHKGTVYNSPFNIVCWGNVAELANKELKKGDKIKLSGELKQELWHTDPGVTEVVKVTAFKIFYKEMDRD